MRRVAATAAVALALGLWPAVSHADDTVVVPGTSFPTTATYLTYFGCTDLYHGDPTGPTVRMVRDDAGPLGRRAVSLAMPGRGTASGAVSLVGSVAAATSEMSVSAAAGSRGVAYVWFVSDELEQGEVWAGRARLTTATDGWQTVDATGATYSWTRYDAASGEVLEQPDPATLDAFTADHGDGPGYLLAGFGCDGREFAVDAIRAGAPGAVTTFDLEGWSVSTSVTASAAEVDPGEEVTLVGRSIAPDQRVMGAPLQLEARPDGATAFAPVGDLVSPAADGSVVTTVRPEETTDYRWVFPETAYTDAHRSAEVRIVVVPPPTEEPTAETAETGPAEPTLPPMPDVTRGPRPDKESPKPDPEPTGPSATPAPSSGADPSPSGSPTPSDSPAATTESPSPSVSSSP